MKNERIKGHISALITIIIWGTTFISTKILLSDFKPVEILFFRFILGLFALTIVYPKILTGTNAKQELTFAAAGFCAITFYYLLENVALTYTSASNVGVIVSVSPFFTAILSQFFSKTKEKPRLNFFIGFALAMTGICLINFGAVKPELNFIGDALALAAALIWAVYSLLSKKISGFGYNIIQTTRRIFAYGIVFMIPSLFVFDFSPKLNELSDSRNLFHMIFLGLGASALCFATWNFAVKNLGAIGTSIYIYMVPVITVTASALILKEKISILSVSATALILAGLLISEINFNFKKRGKTNERQR